MKQSKLYSILLTILVIITVLQSCEDYLPGIAGEGDTEEVLVYIEDFDKISNTTEAEIILSQGDSQEVKIRAQKNIIDNLNLDIRSGKWTIKHDKMVRSAKNITIYITIPDIDDIHISGSGDLSTSGSFQNLKKLQIELTGSGDVDFDGDIRDLEIKTSGSGNTDLFGEAETLDLKITGSGSTYAYSLDTERAEIKLTGSGSAKVKVADYLNATISGSGDVYYRGNPETEAHITGSGRLIDDN